MYFILVCNRAKIDKQCKHCIINLRTMYLEINLRLLSHTFLRLNWSMKTKYQIYFKNILLKLRFE